MYRNSCISGGKIKYTISLKGHVGNDYSNWTIFELSEDSNTLCYTMQFV